MKHLALPAAFAALLLGACSPDNDGACSAAIQQAANAGDIPVLTKRLDAGENVDCLGEWDQTLLIKAIQSGHPHAAMFLIEQGADPGIPDDEGDIAVHRAARRGQLEVFERLVEDTTINARGRHGMTPLMYAANQGRLNIVEAAIERGANINEQCDNGYTALSYTSSPDVTAYLLDAGANPDLKDYRGYTAIQSAEAHIARSSKYGNVDLVARLEAKIEIIRSYASSR